MNPVTAAIFFAFTVVETLGENSVDLNPPNGEPVTHAGLNFSLPELNAASSAWPAVGTSFGKVTISGGTGTIDLTNLPGTNGGTAVNGSTYKVRGVIFYCPTTNAAGIAIAPGASNGYNLFGASSNVIVGPGEPLPTYKQNNAPTISSTAKILTLTGTNGDVLEFGFLLG